LKRFVQMTRTADPHGTTGVGDLPTDMRLIDRRKLGEIERLERQAIVNALARCHGNKSTAAEELGVSRATLYRKIKTYRLS
jgi:sigma-54 dependent transcriptional regulator, acetoin dehydrogenase operon transcriptional activator AcoR